MPSLLEVIALGVLQGLTEFLPVSSSGHLALAQMLFGVEEASLTLSVILHGGTLLAILVVLRRHLAAMAVQVSTQPTRLTGTAAGRDVLFVVVASVPTGVIGFAARDVVARWTASPLVVAIGFFLTAALLVSSRWARGGGDAHPPLFMAFVLGLVQGIAVLPGISRSGSTITAAMWMGVRPDRAFELSMLMSLPAVFGALVLEASEAFGSAVSVGALVLGAAVSFVVGLGALWWLRHSVARGYFSLFALWVLPLALATLALAWSWPAPALR